MEVWVIQPVQSWLGPGLAQPHLDILNGLPGWQAKVFRNNLSVVCCVGCWDVSEVTGYTLVASLACHTDRYYLMLLDPRGATRQGKHHHWALRGSFWMIQQMNTYLPSDSVDSRPQFIIPTYNLGVGRLRRVVGISYVALSGDNLHVERTLLGSSQLPYTFKLADCEERAGRQWSHQAREVLTIHNIRHCPSLRLSDPVVIIILNTETQTHTRTDIV